MENTQEVNLQIEYMLVVAFKVLAPSPSTRESDDAFRKILSSSCQDGCSQERTMYEVLSYLYHKDEEAKMIIEECTEKHEARCDPLYASFIGTTTSKVLDRLGSKLTVFFMEEFCKRDNVEICFEAYEKASDLIKKCDLQQNGRCAFSANETGVQSKRRRRSYFR